jgi:hypothetical protein
MLQLLYPSIEFVKLHQTSNKMLCIGELTAFTIGSLGTKYFVSADSFPHLEKKKQTPPGLGPFGHV